VSNEQSCGPSVFTLIGIRFIHSECLPFLQNQQISCLESFNECDSI